MSTLAGDLVAACALWVAWRDRRTIRAWVAWHEGIRGLVPTGQGGLSNEQRDAALAVPASEKGWA